jgi:hypothetical protein
VLTLLIGVVFGVIRTVEEGFRTEIHSDNNMCRLPKRSFARLSGMAILVCILVLFGLASAQNPTSQISGVVTDSEGSVLPGVRVTVTGPDLNERAITDAQGRFSITGILRGSPARHTVTTELSGFETTVVREIAAKAGGTTHILVQMRVGCLAHIDYVVGEDVRRALESAAVVALVRLDSITRFDQVRLDDYCGPATAFTATALTIVKDERPQQLHPLRFILLEHGAFEEKREYIVFLYSRSGRELRVLAPHYLIPVIDGTIRTHDFMPDELRDGSVVTKVLDRLRSIAKKRQ